MDFFLYLHKTFIGKFENILQKKELKIDFLSVRRSYNYGIEIKNVLFYKAQNYPSLVVQTSHYR
jgi:hypothetical protein